MNKFCIVPINILLDRGFVATKVNNGNKSIAIEYTEGIENIWNDFFNNFSQFKLKNLSLC